jgi:uncharacterized membrane protein YhaH (DUF805 family)
MNFTDAVKACLRDYANFSGRSPRSEYWWFHLFCSLVLIFGIVLLFFDLLIALALILPLVAVNIRRLHDLDKSGWWILIGIIPIAGPIILLFWHISPGTIGDNRFGRDPFENGRVRYPS